MCLVKHWLTETCQDVILIFILQEDFLGAFHLDKISRISGSAENGTRFVRRFVHWKIPRKRGKFKKMGLFSRLGFPNGTSFSVCTFLVVYTSSRSTVGYSHVPGVYDQMEQLFTNRKFHFCSHRNFRVFFLNGKRPLFCVVCARKYKN